MLMMALKVGHPVALLMLMVLEDFGLWDARLDLLMPWDRRMARLMLRGMWDTGGWSADAHDDGGLRLWETSVVLLMLLMLEGPADAHGGTRGFGLLMLMMMEGSGCGRRVWSC